MSVIESIPPHVRERAKRIAPVFWIAMATLMLLSAVFVTLFGRGLSIHFAEGSVWGIVVAGFLLSFMAEYVDSSLGMGYGTSLTPMLLLLGFPSIQVVPAVLLQELISGVLAAVGHHSVGNADLRPGKPALRVGVLLGGCGLVGAGIAATVALNLPESTVKVVTGIIVMSMGLVVIGAGRFRLKFSWSRAGVLGLVAAANKGFMGGGYGPIVTAGQVVGGIDTRSAIAITSLSEACTCAGGLTAYWVGGTGIYWPLAGGMILGGALAAGLAAITVRALPTSKLTIGVAAGCLVLGLLTLLRTFLG